MVQPEGSWPTWTAAYMPRGAVMAGCSNKSYARNWGQLGDGRVALEGGGVLGGRRTIEAAHSGMIAKKIACIVWKKVRNRRRQGSDDRNQRAILFVAPEKRPTVRDCADNTNNS
jgi:hypothetical protein